MIELFTTPHDGKVSKGIVETILNYFRTHNEKSIKITLSTRKTQRSVNQNNLYWLWMTTLEQDQGDLAEDWHRFFASQFLLSKGKNISVIRSTSDLDVGEFCDYMTKIENWCLNFFGADFKLPHPEDLYESDGV
ncbi:MAG TPA: hypothetical protein PK698_06485 [Bacilli bacterium]|nr:hypothetical protein [Bacilli bacterium]